jgi:hypothetical protein
MKGTIMNSTQTLKRLATAVLLTAGLGASSAFGQTFAASGTTTLSVNVAAEASLSIGTSTTNLTSSGTLFADYLGTTNFTYKVRTTQASGTGMIAVQITADFPAGGPSVANSGTTGDTLKFTCASAASGTPCASALTASTATAVNAVTFGADARSAKAGDAGHVDWDLVNDPQYKTGSYSATATFSISAT